MTIRELTCDEWIHFFNAFRGATAMPPALLAVWTGLTSCWRQVGHALSDIDQQLPL